MTWYDNNTDFAAAVSTKITSKTAERSISNTDHGGLLADLGAAFYSTGIKLLKSDGTMQHYAAGATAAANGTNYQAVVADATAGDTIIAGPGTYGSTDEMEDFVKAGVYHYFQPGAVVNFNPSNDKQLVNLDTAGSYYILGRGKFVHQRDNDSVLNTCFYFGNTSPAPAVDVVLEADHIESSSSSAAGLFLGSGTSRCKVGRIISQKYDALWVVKGVHSVIADSIEANGDSDSDCISIEGASVTYGTDRTDIHVNRLIKTGDDGYCLVITMAHQIDIQVGTAVSSDAIGSFGGTSSNVRIGHAYCTGSNEPAVKMIMSAASKGGVDIRTLSVTNEAAVTWQGGDLNIGHIHQAWNNASGHGVIIAASGVAAAPNVINVGAAYITHASAYTFYAATAKDAMRNIITKSNRDQNGNITWLATADVS